MDEKLYHAVIAILIVFLTVAVYLLFQPHETTVTYIGYEQTPFQWYCTEQKANCSTEKSVATRLQKMWNLSTTSDGGTLPDPEPSPTILPTTKPLPVPEFPFLHG